MLALTDRMRWSIGTITLLLAALLLAGCAGGRQRMTPTGLPTAQVSATTEPTNTASASPAPTSIERLEALATLHAQSTENPCSPQDVINYANRVIPLAQDHLEAAKFARSLMPWQQDVPDYRKEYIAADERLEQLKRILAPACADKAHLKFNSSFELLLQVWDHLGEGEFDIAQRQLTSSFEELSQATDLLTQLQIEFDLN